MKTSEKNMMKNDKVLFFSLIEKSGKGKQEKEKKIKRHTNRVMCQKKTDNSIFINITNNR